MISEKDRSEAVTSLRLALSYMLDYEDWYKANDSLFKFGDSTACCGCGDIPGFEGNPFNCVSVKNGSGAVATGKMRDKGTANCFSSISQSAGIYDLIKQKSFYEMMKDSAKMFS